MNGSEDSVPSPKREKEDTAHAAGPESDDEEFHDAQFPAEEETVS